jgi:S-adenosylmethionine:tRNA ribosyltransferase-isomerase
MPLSDFDYELPPELIAQAPAQERTSSRLLLVDRQAQQQDHPFSHHRFANLPSLLPAQSLLVLNDTRVVPARLQGRKETGGKIEVLLVRREPGAAEVWEVLCKGGQGVQAGARVEFSAALQAVWKTRPEAGRGSLEFFPHGNFRALLEQYGEMPLPPYIKRHPGGREEDRERYQTVYAHTPGAVAAPTAGLHFTEALLRAVEEQGIEIVCVTLHVGIGTFQPVRVEQVETHQMEKEEFSISDAAAQRINQAKAAGRKIIAVGTTTTRALESACNAEGQVQACHQDTGLFIYPSSPSSPGFHFRVIDGLITNFHLPRSTLLMLVSAFAGTDVILSAYAEAVARRYRFYSYGDGMLIV